tara:strand:- start:10593 stop:10880 length:288 start_codon:yes stop_codon:yes gene_type:complete
MIVQGSLRYTTCGRKVSSKARQKRRQQVWHWSTQRETETTYRRESKEYSSLPLGKPDPAETAQKEYYASSHTVAPAYNKGAYQVISKENIIDIGR